MFTILYLVALSSLIVQLRLYNQANKPALVFYLRLFCFFMQNHLSLVHRIEALTNRLSACDFFYSLPSSQTAKLASPMSGLNGPRSRSGRLADTGY
jgi:hypothetical protein